MKKQELEHEDARYIVAFQAPPPDSPPVDNPQELPPLGFVHFRFMYEGGLLVAYV